MRAQLSFVLSQVTRLTDRRQDRRIDRILIARPRLHSMQRGKKQTEAGTKNDCNIETLQRNKIVTDNIDTV